MYIFDKKTKITIRFMPLNFNGEIIQEETRDGYTTDLPGFPFAILKIPDNGRDVWVIANRFSGRILKKAFLTKRETLNWFEELAKIINVNSLEYKDPTSTYSYYSEIKEASRNVFFKNYRRRNFGE